MEMMNQKFGRWTVLERAENDNQGNIMYKCKCDCGTVGIKRGTSLRFDARKNRGSCGCLKNERISKRMTKHGKSNFPIYRIWIGIFARCNNPNDTGYHLYGAKGIKVCKRWNEFENFYLDMGNVPDGKMIDRIDNYKGYQPDNCRWVTNKENMRNKRNTRYLTYKRQKKCISEWAEIYNLNHGLLWNRLFYLNWNPEKALTKEVRLCGK